MLDATIRECVTASQQDVGHALASAPMPSGCRWFVVATYPKAERRAHASLHRKGYQAYLPEITVRRRDGWHTGPLFPGYLFLQLEPQRPWYPIRYAPGVFHLLTLEGKPQPVARGAVEALQAATAQRLLQEPEMPWRPGAACELRQGPFQGQPAVILSVGTDMALVSMLMFGQLREVAVDVDCLRARDV